MTNKEAIRVLKAIKEHPSMGVYLPDEYEALDLAIKALEERPQGEWIDYNNTFYKCPECGYLLEKCCPHCQNKVILPNCGADMRGGEDGK